MEKTESKKEAEKRIENTVNYLLQELNSSKTIAFEKIYSPAVHNFFNIRVDMYGKTYYKHIRKGKKEKSHYNPADVKKEMKSLIVKGHNYYIF